MIRSLISYKSREEMERCREEATPILEELYKKYGFVIFEIVKELREAVRTNGITYREKMKILDQVFKRNIGEEQNDNK